MKLLKLTALAVALVSLSACASKQEQPKLDYQTANRKTIDLAVPPDLTNPNQGNLYQLPAGSGAVRASDINRRRASKEQSAADQSVLAGVKGVKMERDGTQRWLTVSGKQPAELWPLLKVFWQENGFMIASEEPAIGQMETEWAENRAKLPADGLRSLFEKVGLGGVYSTGERDKFIIRLERAKNGDTHVFFAHKGMKEVFTNKQEDVAIWQPRANEPNLEAAFLGRFMQYLGMDEQQVAAALQKAETQSQATLAKMDGNTILLSGDFDRNWRRTALALDRIGLTVIGQNTEKNVFLIQPAPAESDAITTKKPGVIARWFGKEEVKPEPLPELLAYVEPTKQGTRISLLNKDGSSYKGKEASTWISRLFSELR